ncbi:MAG TPA: hypothetical protein VLA15_05025 [Desulfurivibrionaceae bacterium]|nr:hypothetical protein [Desulfurivibrionaceae bacterium]
MKLPRTTLYALALALVYFSIHHPLAVAAETAGGETVREAVGRIYTDIVRLQGEDFYRHVDLNSLADGFLADVEPLIRSSKAEAVKNLAPDAPVLAKVLAGDNISAAKAAAKSMFLIDTGRWFNVSTKGKIVSAFAGDAGVVLAQYREFGRRKFLEYRGIKYVKEQGDTAVAAVTIRLNLYKADIQPIGQFRRENGVWRLKKILNVNALVQRVQALERARIASYYARKKVAAKPGR